MSYSKHKHPYLPDPREVDASEWGVITQEDLELLSRLKEFLDEQRQKEEERLQFHHSIWAEALDATGNPDLGCSPEAVERHRLRLEQMKQEAAQRGGQGQSEE